MQHTLVADVGIGREEREGRAHETRRRASLLVRCWVEDSGEGGRLLRGWVRNLHTGQEQAFGDASLIESILVHELSLPEAE